MVSFQCNGCGDILTKPKLEKHREMCLASFDCIDCSKHFETPAEYKAHTSCISEAEKYQKTLYHGVQRQSGPESNGRNYRSWQQGTGGGPRGRQSGDNRQRWQQRNVNQATGANDTPLGTPVRMSPVNDSSVVEGDSGQRKPPSENPKKRKMETEILEPVKKKKKKTAEAQETAGDNITEVGAITESLPQVTDFQRTKNENATQEVDRRTKKKQRGEEVKGEQGKEEKDEKEKHKKDKKKKKDEGKEKEDKGEKEGSKESEKKKAKRKKAEDVLPSRQVVGPGTIVDVSVKVATGQPLATEVPSIVNSEEVRSTKKSSKQPKSKLKVVPPNDAPDTTTLRPGAVELATAAQGDQGHRKKRHASGSHHENNGDAKRVAHGNNESSKEKRKEKKRKRKPEGHDVSVVE